MRLAIHHGICHIAVTHTDNPYFEASNQLNRLVIGPAFGTHRYTEGREEGIARIPGAATVYFTDDTEFKHTLRIKRK